MSEQPYVVASGHTERVNGLDMFVAGGQARLSLTATHWDFSDGTSRERWVAVLFQEEDDYENQVEIADADSATELAAHLQGLVKLLIQGVDKVREMLPELVERTKPVDDEAVIKNRMAANPLVAREVIEERAEERRARWRAAEAESSTTQVAPGDDGATPGRITMSNPFGEMPALPPLPSAFVDEPEPEREPTSSYMDKHVRSVMDYFDAELRRRFAPPLIPPPPAFTVEDLVQTSNEIRKAAQVDQWEILVRDRAAISRLFPQAPVASREDHPEPLTGTLLGIPVREDPTLGWHGEIRNKTTGQRMCYIFDQERDITYQIDVGNMSHILNLNGDIEEGGVNRDSSEEG